MKLKIAEDVLEPLARPLQARVATGIREEWGIDPEKIRQIVAINGLAPTTDGGLVIDVHIALLATETAISDGATRDEMKAAVHVFAEMLGRLPMAVQSEGMRFLNQGYLSGQLTKALSGNPLEDVQDVIDHSCNCEKCVAERDLKAGGVDEPELLKAMARQTAGGKPYTFGDALDEVLDEFAAELMAPEEIPTFDPMGKHELGEGWVLKVSEQEHPTGTRINATLWEKGTYPRGHASRTSIALALLDLQVVLLREGTTVPRPVAEALAPFFAWAQVKAESMLTEAIDV